RGGAAPAGSKVRRPRPRRLRGRLPRRRRAGVPRSHGHGARRVRLRHRRRPRALRPARRRADDQIAAAGIRGADGKPTIGRGGETALSPERKGALATREGRRGPTGEPWGSPVLLVYTRRT